VGQVGKGVIRVEAARLPGPPNHAGRVSVWARALPVVDDGAEAGFDPGGVQVAVVARLPPDVQGVPTLSRGPGVSGDEGDPLGDLDHVPDAGHLPRPRRVEAVEGAAEDRATVA